MLYKINNIIQLSFDFLIVVDIFRFFAEIAIKLWG